MTAFTDLPACNPDFIALAEELADAAQAISRQYFRTGVAVDDKADESPVTIADREAEAAMRRLINERFPDHGIIGEEHGIERADADYVWVLDPIDGTKAFITGNPLFGNLISLTHKGQPLIGIINMPILEERWIGAAGQATCFVQRDGSRQISQGRACPNLDQAVLRSTSPDMFTDTGLMPRYDALRQQVRLAPYGGDCFCYGQLASGFVDLVVEADLQTYDFMALLPVVLGAGGLATDWTGRPLDLQSDGNVLMAMDADLHTQALTYLKD
ncbi:histidinol-phosphatase [Rhodovibrionaceae bacterium A322]